MKRIIQVPNGVRVEISAYADWPTTWDHPVTIVENVISGDIGYQYYNDKIGVYKDMAAATAVQKKREWNEKQMAAAVARQLGGLPPFGRIAKCRIHVVHRSAESHQ